MRWIWASTTLTPNPLVFSEAGTLQQTTISTQRVGRTSLQLVPSGGCSSVWSVLCTGLLNQERFRCMDTITMLITTTFTRLTSVNWEVAVEIGDTMGLPDMSMAPRSQIRSRCTGMSRRTALITSTTQISRSSAQATSIGNTKVFSVGCTTIRYRISRYLRVAPVTSDVAGAISLT